MKYIMLFTFLVFSLFKIAAASESVDYTAQSKQYHDVETFQWNHGAKPCRGDDKPPIQVIQINASSYILRQNKCITFEAPFMYLLVGDKKALVVDSGANKSPKKSPIYQTIVSILEKHNSMSQRAREILLVHSHSHGDHTKGDKQFKGKEGVVVVGTSNEDLEAHLGLTDWPNRLASVDLSGRVVTFIPIPGHQKQSIAIYDDQTQWLMTGDTLYPGIIRISDWSAYRESIKRLYDFSQREPIKLILGGHIEMNAKTNKPYKIGSKYQPDEAKLPLTVKDLGELHNVLKSNPEEKKLTFDEFMISPLSRFEKLLNNALN